jgi:subtilisin family serine protease
MVSIIGCSGKSSPLTNDPTSSGDAHLAAIVSALDGVEVQNNILKELRLNAVDLLPWGIRDVMLDPDGTWPLEIVLEDSSVDIRLEVSGATLLVDGKFTDSYAGPSSGKLAVTALQPEIQIHLSVSSDPAQVRDIIVRTIPSANLPIPPQPGVVKYNDPVTGMTYDVADRELLIGAFPGTPVEVVEAVVGAIGCEILRALPKIDAYRIRIPGGGSFDRYMSLFESSDAIKYAELNAILYPALVPNDTYEYYEYENALVQLYDAWDITTGTDATIVSTVDSGAMRDHPDLYENIIDGEDFISPIGDGLGGETPGNGDDDNNDGVIDGNVGHGTHCAGIIGAVGNNAEGVSGHTWHTKILPCRVFPVDGDSGAEDSAVAEAIMYASDHGAIAISMSLGAYYSSGTEQNAINYAWNNGSAIVAAAGNSGTSQPMYPAAYQNVISVAATNQVDQKASWSNYGSTVDVCAPGVQIMSSIFYEHSGDPWSVPESDRYALMSGGQRACGTCRELFPNLHKCRACGPGHLHYRQYRRVESGV